jgi:hypothetical protein
LKSAFLLLFLFSISQIQSQISGCTDSLSKNYNPLATINDGSCKYDVVKIKSSYSVPLDNVLKETSGLVQSKNLLWTINDDTDTTIYGIDSTGVIKNQIQLKNVINRDWEEITQDSSYFYIGDFGNNVSGNNKDLHILRIEKNSLPSNIPIIDTISFSYFNQTDFTDTKPNSTNFDCEAFIATTDSIYLFTKQWEQKKTSVYALPKIPGNYIAKLKESYDTKGLITGATYLPQKNLVVLCGYDKSLAPFLYLLYDFKNFNFFSGNKRKIKLKLPFHQIEGISTQDGLHYYLTNENFERKPIINVPQKLHQLDLSLYLSHYLEKFKTD